MGILRRVSPTPPVCPVRPDLASATALAMATQSLEASRVLYWDMRETVELCEARKCGRKTHYTCKTVDFI